MKKTFIIILLFFLSITFFSQNINYCLRNLDCFDYQHFAEKNDRYKNHYEVRMRNFNLSNTKLNDFKARKFSLDSLVTQNYWKEIFEYDSEGNMISYIEYHWNDNFSLWEKYWKSISEYDENNNMIGMVWYKWNLFSNNWEKIFKDTNEYDENSNITVLISYSWNEYTELWEEDIKISYEYDEFENIKEVIRKNWNEFSNIWENNVKISHSYIENNKIIEIDGYSWNHSSEIWENVWKETYSYDDNNYLLNTIWNEWNDFSEIWEAYRKTEYINDIEGNIEEKTYYNWDYYSEEWQNHWKVEYSFDYNGNPTLEVYYNWNDIINDWKSYSRFSYTYDLNYNISDLIMPSFDYFLFDLNEKVVNKPIYYSFYNWHDDINDWGEEITTNFYYSDLDVYISPNLSDNLKIFPNPFNETIYIEHSNSNSYFIFELYDTKSRLITSQKINGNKPLSFGKLNPGIYIYKIIFNNEIKTGKLFKK